MATWHPGAISYRDWRQAENYDTIITNSLNQQTNQIVASQNQAKQAVSSRLDRIAEINSAGFHQVSNAVESFHSDFNYNMGLLFQEMQIQSRILDTILYTLKNPLKTQVEELYNDGCRLIRESILDKAIQKFTNALKLDDTSFLCNYQLGLLYLAGKTDDENVINIRKANEFLLMACRFGKGKAKIDSNFNPVVANALFFAFNSNRVEINELLKELRTLKAVDANRTLKPAQSIMNLLSKYEISDTIYEDLYVEVETHFNNAHDNYISQTFFGYICSISSCNIVLQKGQSLLESLEYHNDKLKSLKKSDNRTYLMEIVKTPYYFGWGGLIVGILIGVPGCFVTFTNADGAFDVGWKFFKASVLICTIIGIVIGLIIAIASDPGEYKKYMNSIRKK